VIEQEGRDRERDDGVRGEPFDTIENDLERWWQDGGLEKP
jgi:hypothetical protein